MGYAYLITYGTKKQRKNLLDAPDNKTEATKLIMKLKKQGKVNPRARKMRI